MRPELITPGKPRLEDSSLLRRAKLMWRENFNTDEIATALKVDEASVYNSLWQIKRG